PGSDIRAHRLAVRMAVDQESIVLSRKILLSPCYETLQSRGVSRIQVNITIFGDFRKMNAARESLYGILFNPVEPGAGEILAQKGSAFLVPVAAVDEKDQLHSRIVVDRAAHLVSEIYKIVIPVVIHCSVEEDGPGTFGSFGFRPQ